MHYKLEQTCVTIEAALFYYKLGQMLLKIVATSLLQLGQVLLQIGAAITK